MANRERGEFDITIGDTTYTLVVDTDAMVALEDLFTTPSKDVTFDEVVRMANKGKVKATRAFVWASFLRYQPEMTMQTVNDLIQAAGGLGKFSLYLQKLAAATVPDLEDIKALGAETPNPPMAQAKKRRGTGDPFTSMHGVSA